ncbi:MAG: penicillin-binding protein 2 [Candidatus Latescibacterota bacterium]|nr:MAG: penicillin-binding protein 2 [Candidatus Latescibacterota bacterium]
MPEDRIRRKVLVGGMLGAFVLLWLRTFSLQIVHGDYYRRLSEENRVRVEPIEALRGPILDRNGDVLVENRPSYTVAVLPSPWLDSTLALLSELTGISAEEIKRRASAQRRWPRQPVKVKRDLPFPMLASIEERRYELPGVIYQIEPRRSYPFGDLAAHVLGYVGEPTRREFARLAREGYLYGELVGRSGVELYYERLLHGRPGARYVEVDAFGREVRELSRRDPAPGAKLYLTLDLRLQEVAEEAFGDGRTGALVALDPRNGEILAMVSRPSFSPELLSGVLSEDLWERIRSDTTYPLLNRAVQSSYPPGSSLKPLTAIVGLVSGIDDEDFVPCCGSLRFGDRVFRCWGKHGRLDVIGAIAQSCDVYFYQMAEHMDVDIWAEYAEALGLGRPTGVDLPGEEEGLIPSREYYGKEWAQGIMLNLAIGQGEILVTPIQMARYVGAIATGRLVRPHVLLRVEEPDGRSFSVEPEVEEVPIPPDVLSVVRKGMLEAVEGEEGTGRAARVPGVKVAGKTGTAQNPHGEHHAWFVAFAPYEDPTIALAVVVERAGCGGAVAAPIAGKVLSAYFSEMMAGGAR